MNQINATQLGSYCRRMNLCTGMSLEQYDRVLGYAENSHNELTKDQKARDVACMIIICSHTSKTIDELTQDIKEMFYE